MEHFHENIFGYMSCHKLYKRMVEQAQNGAVFVELGVYRGKSAAFMAVEIIKSGKKIEFYAVDHFKGSPELMSDSEIAAGELFQKTKERLEKVSNVIKFLPLASIDAAKVFADESIDFIYIDAAHEYDDVKADIKAWYPKVKRGGIISGDDYAIHSHPGVRKAVDEIFPDADKEDVMWLYKKPE